jgi:hypothetical protein
MIARRYAPKLLGTASAPPGGAAVSHGYFVATDNEEHSIGGARPQKKIRRVGRTWGGRCR